MIRHERLGSSSSAAKKTAAFRLLTHPPHPTAPNHDVLTRADFLVEQIQDQVPVVRAAVKLEAKQAGAPLLRVVAEGRRSDIREFLPRGSVGAHP